jgi:micrococcal nuclease
VRPVDTDRYGRTPNHELVRSGLAWWFEKYAPGDATLARLEAEAREARRGLWSQPHPIPPWDWRQHKGLPAGLATQVIGNRRSLVYHRPTCASVARIAGTNRVTFPSETAATAAGYRPGRDCYK